MLNEMQQKVSSMIKRAGITGVAVRVGRVLVERLEAERDG
jgi:hypothetical protein